ncbi:hypothetical protein [Erwinia amylovora]
MARSVAPVSYTHLDVYKRQDKERINSATNKRYTTCHVWLTVVE